MRPVLLTSLAVAVLLAAAACTDEPGGPAGPTPAADTGYEVLLDRLALEAGDGMVPILLLGDVSVAAETADVELPPPGAHDWQVAGIDRLSEYTLLPATSGLGLALQRLPETPDFAETLGVVPTDVAQWAEWFGTTASGQTAAMTLRGDTDELVGFLDDSDSWARQDDDPRWYRPVGDPGPQLKETLEWVRPAEPALVVDDAAVQLGPAPADSDGDPMVPTGLAPQRDTVGELPGANRLARQLEGWATLALVVPEPHQPFYVEDVEAVGEPLEPYQHVAVAAVADEAGARTGLVLAHADEATARTNAERVQGNVAAHDDIDGAEVRRDGTIVVVDWLRDDAQATLRALHRMDFGLFDVAVPAEPAGDDQ